MVDSRTEHPILRSRAVLLARRAHPVLILGAVAGAGFFAGPALVAPIAALTSAWHHEDAGTGDRLAGGTSAVAGTAPAQNDPAPVAAPQPAAVAPAPVPSFAPIWLPPPRAPEVAPKVTGRAQSEPASAIVRRYAPQRQARLTPAPAYRAQSRPAYAGRSVVGNRQFNRFDGGGFKHRGGWFGGGFFRGGSRHG